MLSLKPSSPCPWPPEVEFPNFFSPQALLKSKQLPPDTSWGQTCLSAVRDALAGFLPSHCRLPPSLHQSTRQPLRTAACPWHHGPQRSRLSQPELNPARGRKTGRGGRKRELKCKREPEREKVHLGFGLPGWNLSSRPPEPGRQALCGHAWVQQRVPSDLLVGCMREGAFAEGSGTSLFIYLSHKVHSPHPRISWIDESKAPPGSWVPGVDGWVVCGLRETAQLERGKARD